VNPKRIKRRTGWGRYLLWTVAGLLLSFYGLIVFSLVLLRWVNPPTTAIQTERRVQSWFDPRPYQKRYAFVPLSHISPALQHAVISAEDARFYQHHGFDWRQVQLAATEDAEGKRLRGASTIDQQLVKNLFLTTSRSLVRKAIEATIVPFAEVILGKRRILELYLNVVEWGPAVYGAEAASSYWYRSPASRITRDAGARLAAVLPAPHRRRPANMNAYAGIILDRMRQAGW
jgi:monofunctional biosynthetic peptidoglycan transglycosylase